MGNGSLFLPVKAEIRKKIKKQEGDTVQVILYLDNEPLEIPEEILLCLAEPCSFTFFKSLNQGEQKNYIQHIFLLKNENIKISQIINRL